MIYKGKPITWKRYKELQKAKDNRSSYEIAVHRSWLRWLREGDWK